MADIYATLIQSAIFKRAALLEQWLARHSLHYPGPQLEVSNRDFTLTTARCTCGESYEVAILVSIEGRRGTKQH